MEHNISGLFSEQVGALPLIASYLNKINFAENIDNIVGKLRLNNRRFSHGNTCFVLVLYLIFRSHAIYKVEEWVKNTSYLQVLFPDILPEYFNDDRIADTFIALSKKGISDIFASQTMNVIEKFNLNVEQVHCDFSSFMVHGNYEGFEDEDGILITYGYSKDHRPDKKQFMQEVVVSEDGGVPIATKTLDGNTSDVTRYLPIWKSLKHDIGTTDFIMVGDCKLSSNENLLGIAKGAGFFLAPLAMYSTLKEELVDFIINQKKIPTDIVKTAKNNSANDKYAGFEIEATLYDVSTHKEYKYRKIFVHSTTLQNTRMLGVKNRIDNALEDLRTLNANLNNKRYNSREKVDCKISKILKKYDVNDLITYQIIEYSKIEKKKIGRGKPTANSNYEESIENKIALIYHVDSDAMHTFKETCGYFVLATNKPVEELSIKQAIVAYKQEWHVERIFKRLKGSLQVLPMNLKLPRHIESMMYLLVTCVQIFTLIDREAKASLVAKGEKLSGIFPNKIQTASPKTEQIIEKFENFTITYVQVEDKVVVIVPKLNTLQSKLLEITGGTPLLYEAYYIQQRLMNKTFGCIQSSERLNS